MKSLIPAIASLVILALASPASGQTTATVYTDEAAFQAATGASRLSMPASDSLLEQPFGGNPWQIPSSVSYSCNWKTVGIGVPGPGIPDGTESVLVTANTVDYICMINYDWPHGGTGINPPPTGPTIVGNGPDNYLITPKSAVTAIGLELLTNNPGVETITITFDDSTTQVVSDADVQIARNSVGFVGFAAPKQKQIQSLLVETVDGKYQDEGIVAISIKQEDRPPEGPNGCPTPQPTCCMCCCCMVHTCPSSPCQKR